MKKLLVSFTIIAVAFFSFIGCTQKKPIDATELNEQGTVTEPEPTNTEAENGIAVYVITFRIKQSHFTLSVSEHIKDAMNEISFDVPVDKEYYDSVSVGDVINDNFRVGSLIMHGSFGSWKVTIDQKEVRYQPEAEE